VKRRRENGQTLLAEQAKLPRHHRPERIAYIRQWRGRNRDRLRRLARASYLRDREHILAENRRRRESLRQFVTPEELKACQADPRKAKTIRSPNGIVCLDCGETLETLSRHLGLVHAMTADRYRKKWGYNKNTPLCSENLTRKFSGQMKRRQLRPPQETQARAYLTKMRSESRVVQRAEPRRLEHRLNVRDWTIGRARSERWKVPDWSIVRQRLEGKKMRDISRATGLSGPEAVSARLGRLGLAGERCELPVFVRGRPFTWPDLHKRAKEFGMTLQSACQHAGASYSNCYSSAWRRSRPVPKRTAEGFLKLLDELTDRFCYQCPPGHNRVREFLPSELSELSKLFSVLKEAFRQIGEWTRSQENLPRVEDVMDYICGQARREVARERIAEQSERTFRTLLQMGLALDALLREKPALARGHFRSLSEAAAKLLARLYGTTPGRIIHAVSGKLPSLDPRTLGQEVRRYLAERRPAVGGRGGRSKLPVEKRRFFQIGRAVEQEVPRLEAGLRLLSKLRQKSPTEPETWKLGLAENRYSSNEIDALLASKTAVGAAERVVARLLKDRRHPMGLRLRAVQEACARHRKAMKRPS
jgi:predicted transcriptional regulator